MKLSIKKGLSFGLTSGVITTLGLMVGLNSGIGLKKVVLGGIFTIAIADAFSDALGIHMSEEAESHKTNTQIWTATIATFIGKLIFALTFAIPVILFPLSTAINISIVYGMVTLALLSWYLAKQQKGNVWKAIGEHLLIAIAVIATTHWMGHLIGSIFG